MSVVLAKIFFWTGMGWVVYVYLGYPALLWILGLFRRGPSRTQDDFTPFVSVLISARNEERDIGWKIQQTLGWDYPEDRLQLLIASDASEDRTDEIVSGIKDPRLIFVRMQRRVGKNSALNHLASVAQGEILFFTDANSHVSSASVRKLVRHFADPGVGSVTGWEQTADEGELILASGGRASLGYESTVNQLESRLGSVLVCDGSIFCIRKSLFRQLHPELANDLELPVWVGHRGYKLLYEPNARSAEKATSSAFQEFDRRRRICGQGFLAMWKLRGDLHGLRAWQFASRKLLRWLTLIPLLMIVGSSLVLQSFPLYRALLVLQLSLYAFAGVGWLLTAVGRKGPALLSLPFYFLLLNTAAMVGVIEACMGRRFAVWDIPTLSRGPEQATY